MLLAGTGPAAALDRSIPQLRSFSSDKKWPPGGRPPISKNKPCHGYGIRRRLAPIPKVCARRLGSDPPHFLGTDGTIGPSLRAGAASRHRNVLPLLCATQPRLFGVIAPAGNQLRLPRLLSPRSLRRSLPRLG